MSVQSSFVWAIADLLRGPFRPNQYGDVVLPFTILRRLEAVMAPHREAMAAAVARSDDPGIRLQRVQMATGLPFYNTSNFTLATALHDSDNLAANLMDYVNGFSPEVDVFKHFDFAKTIAALDAAERLIPVTSRFAMAPLGPEHVSNAKMGDLFEHLIFKDFEASNAEAGDFYTPRDAIRLLVDLLFAEDNEGLTKPGITRSVYDPTAGTGGMLSVAEDHLLKRNPGASLALYAQEINPESYAIAKSDLLIKGQDIENVRLGDTLADDQFWDRKFDFVLSNPPYGVDWKASEKAVRADAAGGGRFAPGLPSVSDGSMLFLLHVADKMRPMDKAGQGGRAGIVLNGSPLFNGGAGSGPSDIRGHLLENDLLDAIVALPTDMFYNTGIATYLWILDNTKPAERQGKVQLIDATALGTKMRKALGSKRVEITDKDAAWVVHAYDIFEDDYDAEGVRAKVFDAMDFAYWQITVERPLRLNFSCTSDRIEAAVSQRALEGIDGLRSALESFGEQVYMNRAEFLRILGKHLGSNQVTLTTPQRKALALALGERDENADICTDSKGNPEPDPKLRDTELVPFGWSSHAKEHEARDQTIADYMAVEVLPHVPDSWVDATKTKVGYEIPFTRHFYRYVPPRSLIEIDADLDRVVGEMLDLLKQVEA